MITEQPIEDYVTAWLWRARACLDDEAFERFLNSWRMQLCRNAHKATVTSDLVPGVRHARWCTQGDISERGLTMGPRHEAPSLQTK
jgi:hypothetical protein